MLTPMGALTKFFTSQSAGLTVIILAVFLGLSNRLDISRSDFEPPFERGDTFYYEIYGRQISDTTDLKHNGTMHFTVLMRNSTHIRIKEVKHETVSGISDLQLTYIEFHPVTYALIHIRSRALEPFGISVWHWVDPTTAQIGKNSSIVGENMAFVEKVFWEKGNISRLALRFLATKALPPNSNRFAHSWYDCYYDAVYGYPLLFSTHFHQWEEQFSYSIHRQSTSKLENRTLSRSSYFFSFVSTNATFSNFERTDSIRSPDPVLAVGMALLILSISYANLSKKRDNHS